MKAIFSKRHIFTSAVSVLLSVFTVAVVAYGASLVNTSSVGSGTSTPGAALGVKGAGLIEGNVWATSFTATSTGYVGIGTSTPGAALGVKGAGIFEGFVSADYFTSTSTSSSWMLGKLGIGTTTPGADLNNDGGLAVAGGALIGNFVYTSYFTATSTTATSTTRFGINVASSSLNVDGVTGRIAVGTTTFADADVVNTQAVDPALTIAGVGSTASATGTLYVAGGGNGKGGQIILMSTDGNNCVSLMATTGANDLDASALTIADLLSAKVVACPR